MNFYKHHIGDYDQATRHLSFVEDAAYSRLIRKYYAEETPLPAEVLRVQRLVGARTEEEKEAVQVVLDEFFTLEEDGWHSKRCDEEIAKADDRAEKNRQIALAREAGKRALLEHDNSTNRDENSTNRAHVVDESFEDREPSQTPDSRLQTPEKKKPKEGDAAASLSAKNLVEDGLSEDLAKELISHRKRKKAALTQRSWNGIKNQAQSAGWPLVAAVEKLLEKGWTGFEAAWVAGQSVPTGANSSSHDDNGKPSYITVPEGARWVKGKGIVWGV